MPDDLIVAMIDDELERLRHIRSILVPLLGLSRPPKLRQASSQVEAPVPDAAPEVAPTIIRLPSRERRRYRPRNPKPVEPVVALRGAIPSSPVVIRPSVAKATEQAPESPVPFSPGSFAAMVRAAEKDLQPTF